MPGQIWTAPVFMACAPVHCMNWPMESSNPPSLCRKGGVQGSSKAELLGRRSRRSIRSAARKMGERRLAPMGSSR